MRKFLSPRFLLTILLLSGAIFVARLSEKRIPEQLAVPLDRIDTHISGWTAVQTRELEPNVLHELKPTSYLSRQYGKGNRQLDLFIAFYAQQRPGESMHSPKHCLPGSGWEIWKQESNSVPVKSTSVQVNKYSIQNSGQRLLMFYWYQSKDRIIASEYMGKILLARDTLLTGRTAASIVRITIPDQSGASQEGVAFASALIEQMQHCFGIELGSLAENLESK